MSKWGKRALAILAEERGASGSNRSANSANSANRGADGGLTALSALLATPLSSDFEERAAIAEYDGGAPRAWAEAFAKLQCLPAPDDVSASIWIALIDGAGRFLDQQGGPA